MVAGGREAKAGLSVSSLNITSGIVVVSGGGTGTDPQYTYEFTVVLDGTIDGSHPATSLTVDNLVGLSSGFSLNYLGEPYPTSLVRQSLDDAGRNGRHLEIHWWRDRFFRFKPVFGDFRDRHSILQ